MGNVICISNKTDYQWGMRNKYFFVMEYVIVLDMFGTLN